MQTWRHDPDQLRTCSGSLYPAQSERVDRYLASPAPHRGHLPWQTGTGKTVGACRVVSALHPRTALIICPAVVRVHWQHELLRWCERWAHVIEWGRAARLPKAKNVQRIASYNAHTQIVSYDLLGDITVAPPWELIILDELHHLAHPKSKQSGRVARLIAANPGAAILGLTATLIPTEVRQLWNPMRLIYGEREWGEPSVTGDVSPTFLRTYCETERSQYGASYSGCRPEMRERLERKLRRHAEPLSREQIADDLPPLDLHTLELSGDSVNTAVEWAREQAAAGTKKLVLLFHKRETARAVHDALDFADWPRSIYVDGETAPSVRQCALDDCAAFDKAILVGTYGALLEGVRMMWAEQVLIDEWSMSPGRLLQTLGRFQSVGSGARPSVNLRTHPGNFGQASQLLYRIRAMSEVAGSNKAVETLATHVSARVDSEREVSIDEWSELFNSQLAEVEPDGDGTQHDE